MSGKDLARLSDAEQADLDLRTAKSFASVAVQSQLCGYKRDADVVLALYTGRELGLGPAASLRAVQVVQGRPVIASAALVAAVRRSGSCASWRTVECDPMRCTVETLRRGEEHPERVTWTMEDARRAGLGGKGPWQQYPAQMLYARAAADLARRVYPDVCMGIYTPEELGAAEEPLADDKPQELDGAALEPEPAPEQDPEALQSFFARVAEIELPGEGVAVWMKHREALGALDPRHRETAWKALCKRIEDVGKMANAKVWLKKAIAEEDARRTPPPDGPRGGGAPAPQASNTNATGAATESAPANGARALAAVPTWAADEEGIRWHLSTKSAVRALENSVRLHGRALTGTSYLHLAAERLCALSPADERGTRLSAESARRRVDGWAEAGPVSASQPTAKAV